MVQDLILFSHLRWRQQPQRPHRVAQARARRGRVFFLEEPVWREGIHPYLETEQVGDQLYVCQMYLSGSGGQTNLWPGLTPLLNELLERHHIKEWVAWLCTPAVVPLLHGHEPLAIVYDCTTELQVAIQGKPGLQQAEAELLSMADLVLANSPYLHRQLQSRHPQVHCLIDAIDQHHFRRNRALPESGRQADLPRPRLGFFGTIDERLDVALLDRIARAHPDWQLILVGPVIHLEEEEKLPQHSNIHYFGWERYEQLPHFLVGWDLCILPLRQGACSCFTNPSRLLEHLATGHPVVSTKVADFQEYFELSARFTDAGGDFVRACEEALAEPDILRQQRRAGTQSLLDRVSWDRSLAMIDTLLEQAIRNRRPRPPLPARKGGGLVPVPVPARPRARPPLVILGASLVGLGAARQLGREALVLEREGRVGGRCRLWEGRGFLFDRSGLVLLSRRADLHSLYRRLLGDNVQWRMAERWIHTHGTQIRYPFHASLHGLPPAVVSECLMGLLKLRLMSSKELESTALPGMMEGALESTLPLSSRALPFRNRRQQPRNLEDAIYESWGTGIACRFLVPYNRKFWGLPLHELDATALQGTPMEWDLEQVVNGALHPDQGEQEQYFGYPRRGGLQALAEAMAADMEGELRLEAEVVAIHPEEQRLVLANGETILYRGLISTLPLACLLALVQDELPDRVRKAAQKLRYLSLRLVHLGIGREQVTDKHWLYCPGDALFHRVFVRGSVNPGGNAPGGFALTCEITYGAAKPLPLEGEALLQRCIQDCRNLGLIRADDPVWVAVQEDVPDVYLIPDLHRNAHLAVIDHWLDEHGILRGEAAQLEPDDGCDREILLGQELAKRARLLVGEAVASV